MVIVIDTLRADRLPFYGYPKDTMPFLNSLAPWSSVFTKAYAGSSWTAPATASIFTGLYPFQHGVIMGLLAQNKIIKKNPAVKINRIPENVLTLPEIFKAHGYRTFGISDNVNISEPQGFGQGFYNLQTLLPSGRKENQSDSCLLWKMKSNHRPDISSTFITTTPTALISCLLKNRNGAADDLTDSKLRYDKELTHIDQCIRRLFRRFGWDRNTLIVVTADHGEEMKEKGFYGHGTSLFNTVIHVPLLFFYPHSRSVVAGRVPTPVSTLDILPTLNALLGFKELGGLAGKDLSPWLKNPGAAAKDRHIYSHLQLKKADRDDTICKAAIFNDYKYIYHSIGGVSSFFDLKNDPQEIHNLFSGNRKFADKLAANYFNFEQHCARYNPDYVGIKLDKKNIELLKTLGYIQ